VEPAETGDRSSIESGIMGLTLHTNM